MRLMLKNKGLQTFLISYLLFFVAGLCIILFTKKGDDVLFINRLSHPFLDPFAVILTTMGLGGYLAIFAFSLTFVRIRYAIICLLNLALVSVLTNILKHYFFSTWTRPLFFFSYDDFYRYINYAEINYYYSFPSGHTMAIFGTLATISYFIGKRSIALLLFFLALLVGLSRIYLLQHFFIDVFGGAFLGMCSSILIIWISERFLTFLKRPYFNKSLLKLSAKIK